MIISSNSQGVFQKKNHRWHGVKVLQVLPALGVGGVEVGTVQIAKALKSVGSEPHVVSSGGQFEEILQSLGVRVHRLPLASKNPVTIFKNAKALLDLIEREKIDLVHVRSRGPAWSVLRALRNQKTPWIATFHGTYNFNSTLKKLYNSVMVRGRKVIAISDFIRNHIEKHYGSYVSASNIHVIHRGVDCERFSPDAVSTDAVEQFKKDLGISLHVPVITMPGRLTAWKGQKIFIEALSSLKQFHFQALIVGPSKNKSDYKQALHELINKLGLSKQVQVLEGVDSMPLLYKASDVVVHASVEPEGFGRTIIEAQACGRPVIASKLGAPCEIIEEGLTGFLIPPADPKMLACAIERYLTLPDKEKEMLSFNSRLRAQTYFSEALMCDRTLNLYADILEC